MYFLCIYTVESCMPLFQSKLLKYLLFLNHPFEKAKTPIDCIFYRGWEYIFYFDWIEKREKVAIAPQFGHAYSMYITLFHRNDGVFHPRIPAT